MVTQLLKLLLISILLFAPAALAEDLYVEGQMTSAVVNGNPVDEITATDTSNHKTFFFSRINNCRGCVVTHAWYLDGSFIYQYQTTVRYSRTKWWTTRPGNGVGTWEVRMSINGEEVQRAQVDYQLASYEQQQQVNVQSRLKDKTDSECSENLTYFRGLSQTNPDDPYYRFMTRKWEQRCQ